MHRERLQDAVVACAFFAGTVLLFETALYAPWIGRDSASYLAAIVGLTVAAVLATALLATIAAGRAAPQIAVVTLAALTILGIDAELTAIGAARAGIAALALAIALLVDRELRGRPVSLALLSATAACGSFRVWRQVCSIVDALHPLAHGTDAALAEALVFAACIGLALAYSAVRRRRFPRLPAAATVASVALVLATIGVHAADLRWNAKQARLAAAPQTAFAPAGRTRTDTGAVERPSILVLLLDTVSADRLSIYGHSRETTPELQRLLDGSERAVRYPLVFAPAPWTLPSHASLFTGVLPSEHGIERSVEDEQPRIRHRVLSQALREQGYRTTAVLANPILDDTPGLLDGFDRVTRALPLHAFRLTVGATLRALWLPQIGARATKPTPDAERINAGVLNAVRRCAGAPCFVFANYMDAHDPYAPPAAYAGRWESDGPAVESEALRRDEKLRRAERLRRDAARYDEAVRGLDAALGKLFGELAAAGVLDRWWIVITADHGEAFGEHGVITHGKGLHVEQTKIPLVILPPSGVRLEARGDPVSLLDVAATLAAVGGIEGFGTGDDLRRPGPGGGAPVAMEFAGRGKGAGEIPPSRAVVVGRRQLIESAGRRELYDLDSDPRERHDLAKDFPGEVERLAAFLPPGIGRRSTTPPSGENVAPADEIDEESLRDLRTLGYVD